MVFKETNKTGLPLPPLRQPLRQSLPRRHLHLPGDLLDLAEAGDGRVQMGEASYVSFLFSFFFFSSFFLYLFCYFRGTIDLTREAEEATALEKEARELTASK